MSFAEYCVSKNMDAALFQSKEPVLFAELQQYFDQVHPESFTQQKKFLINPIRRRYQLKK
jgi:hypothetical protein